MRRACLSGGGMRMAARGGNTSVSERKYASSQKEYASSKRKYASSEGEYADSERKYASNRREYASSGRKYASSEREYASSKRKYASSGGNPEVGRLSSTKSRSATGHNSRKPNEK